MMKASCKLLDNNGLQQSQTLSMCKPSLINRKKRLQLSNKHKYILGWLSHGDVLSNELIYHTLSLTKYTNQCNSLLSTNNIDSAINTWIKELVLNSIILCIGGTELVGSDSFYGLWTWSYVCWNAWWPLHRRASILQSFYLQGLQGYSKGWLPTSWAYYLILLFKIALKIHRMFLNHW